MKKIKVGVILPGLGYIERGNEVAFTEYIKRFAQKDDLEIFVFGAGKNFRVKNATYFRTLCPMRHWFKYYPKIKRLHLTHNHDYELMFFSVLLIPKLLKQDLDVILFSSFPFTLLPIKLYKKFKNKKVKIVFNPGGGSAFVYSRFFSADAITATDPTSQQLYSKKFKTLCIPAGVDSEIFRPQKVFSREELNLPQNKFIILSASALDPIKRIDFLIKAASKVKDAFLLVAGSGVQGEYLKKLGKNLMGENILFVGSVDQVMLSKYYSISDVFCLPSKIEPFGLVLVEAMACQTPVVTNNTEIQKWIVNGGGSCIDVGDINGLVKALEKYKNKELAKETGIEGRQNVLERFTWDIAAEKYYQLFKKLVKSEI
jgi:glycosyltransferase involved in cell wall biosynthesis